MLTSCLILLACSPQPQFEPELDQAGKELKITLIVHDNRRDLNIAYNEWVGSKFSLDLSTPQLGWATWTDDTCTIHIDSSLSRQVFLDTLGHEYAHCIYGRYHD